MAKAKNNRIANRRLGRTATAGRGFGSQDAHSESGEDLSLDDYKQDIIDTKMPKASGGDRVDRRTGVFTGSDSAASSRSVSVAPGSDGDDGDDDDEEEIEFPGAKSKDGAKSKGGAAPGAGDDQAIVVTPTELKALIRQQADQAAQDVNRSALNQNEALRDELQRMREQADADRKTYREETERAIREQTRLKAILSVTGNEGAADGTGVAKSSNYGINVLTFPISQEPRGAARDFIDMGSNPMYTPKFERMDQQNGLIVQRNHTAIDQWLRNKDNWLAVKADMELLFKAHGFLTGGDAYGRDSAGPTRNVPSSIPDFFLDYLSATIRFTHASRNIWWQFPTQAIDIGQMPGQTVRITRFADIPQEDSIEGYILDDGTTGIAYGAQSQGLSQTHVQIKVATYGLGRGVTDASKKLSLTAMVLEASIDGLLQTVSRVLGRSFRSFEDTAIRQVYELARTSPDNIFYNDGGQLSSNPASILSGNDGTLTTDVLSALSSEMTMEDIPTFDNGKRVAVVNPKGAASLRASVSDKISIASQAELEAALGMLHSGTLGNGLDQIRGYIGDLEGFMIFESPSMARGMPGSNGVYSVNTGVGPRLMRDNYFFGPGVAAYAISSPMEIREEDGPFRNRKDFVWQTTCGFGPMDCSSHLDNSQQTRVRILRTADAPI